MLDLVTTFEIVAAYTWKMLQGAVQYNSDYGEQSCTEHNLLQLNLLNCPSIRIVKVNNRDETKYGIDWEWWIGSNSRGWWRYAVQAKKLYGNNIYQKLNYTVKSNSGKFPSKTQHEILRDFALRNRAIPIYCFYNYSAANLQPYWHCSADYDQTQFGCTLVPFEVVRDVAEKPLADRTFEQIHHDHRAIPWRCLVKCPIYTIIRQSNGFSLPNPLGGFEFAFVNSYEVTPEYADTNSKIIEFDALPSSLYSYSGNIRVAPKRIMVVDLG